VNFTGDTQHFILRDILRDNRKSRVGISFFYRTYPQC